MVCWLLISIGSNASAQQILDSLLKVLPPQRGMERVKTLGEVQWELGFTDPVKGMSYGTEALQLAADMRDSAAVAIAANDMAVSAHRAGRYPLAVALNHRALRIRSLAGDSVGMAASHAKLSPAFTEMARYDSALHHGFVAADLYELLHNARHSAQVRGNLARLYQLNGDLRMAERAATKAVELLETDGNDYALAAALGQLGSIQQDAKNVQASRRTTERCVAMFEQLGAWNDAATAANQLGAICRQMGDKQEGEEHYRKALALAEQGGDLAGVAAYSHNFGNTLFERGAFAEALVYYERSLTISRANGFMRTHLDVLPDHAQALEKLGRYAEALASHRELVHLSDSLNTAERSQSLADMQVKYETERTEKALLEERARTEQQQNQLAQQRLRIVALGGGLALLALIAVLFVSVQRARLKGQASTQLIAERERGLKAMLESTDAERKRIAGELHDGVGQQLTGLKFRLEDVAARISERLPDEGPRMKEVLGLADEAGKDVRGIAHSMMPRALGDLGLAPALNDMLNKSLARPGMHHTFEHFGLDARLPQQVEVGVYRIAQELVGNILKHADARNIHVQVLKNKNNLVLIVEDDGKGIDAARTGNGIGLLNMHDRARAMHGHIEFDDAPTTGTVVTLRVPLTNGNSV
ncbi:MAG: sensor histidine kinase [Flavobacteriales bacterium]|nr:sensor histidine kinase [Flavobacteriales bacterium]